MATETEVKLQLEDLEGFLRRLDSLGPTLLHSRHLEDNYILDFQDGRLRSRGCLLRVRITAESATLTYKEAARPDGSFKTREEFETSVLDGGSALEILAHIGLNVWFRYQKYRREYSVAAGTRAGGEVLVAVDETPVGSFAELEGSKNAIRKVAGKMGFAESQFLSDSYYSLYLQFCREQRSTPGYMTFK